MCRCRRLLRQLKVGPHSVSASECSRRHAACCSWTSPRKFSVVIADLEDTIGNSCTQLEDLDVTNCSLLCGGVLSRLTALMKLTLPRTLDLEPKSYAVGLTALTRLWHLHVSASCLANIAEQCVLKID